MGQHGRMAQDELEIRPLTADRWPDMVDLFERPGPRGAWARTGACYCMFWRLEPAAYEENFRSRSLENVTGGPNKHLMSEIVGDNRIPGLLAYRDSAPVGWVSVTPRSDLVRLQHAAGPASGEEPADSDPWSISCFYVYRSDQGSSVGTQLLEAAVDWAREHDATSVEAYPVKVGNIDPYTGYDVMFEAAGFHMVKPGRGRGRALWRLSL